ncbi:PcfB family protein [Faecalicoccus pleomorphus]|uniref:PcfB family protein n=1 Tax=Faecalicoccus pleomorphus TaxID=1323 RepID=UPI00189BB07E|nr:PcfB family protein [Faecalicoccus pleomorphus]MDB7984369.1 PcfB family protein [Faecalicoccus pleomorphus]
MNTGSEAADQVIRMSLNGVEVAARISGKAAIEIAQMLHAVLKNQQKTKGKTRLVNLLKTGKPLEVFTLQNQDLMSFQKEAKKYGILYYAVRNQRSSADGLVDIMVKKEDAPRINRIVERFKLADVSKSAQIKTEIQKKQTQKEIPEKEHPVKDAQILEEEETKTRPVQKEVSSSNPQVAKTTKSRPSEPVFRPSIEGHVTKPSVREQLHSIEQKMQTPKDVPQPLTKTSVKSTQKRSKKQKKKKGKVR